MRQPRPVRRRPYDPWLPIGFVTVLGGRATGSPNGSSMEFHTHDPRSDAELVLPSAPFPEVYLPASAASLPRVVRSRSRTPWMVAAPDQAVPSIESPPPQLPG